MYVYYETHKFGEWHFATSKIMAYPSLPKQTVKWDTLDSNDIISWMKVWHEELRHDQQEFLELYMKKFGCTRNEAKARTFGVRYGSNYRLGKESIIHYSAGVAGIDYSSLERIMCGTSATSIIGDDYLGPKTYDCDGITVNISRNGDAPLTMDVGTESGLWIEVPTDEPSDLLFFYNIATSKVAVVSAPLIGGVQTMVLQTYRDIDFYRAHKSQLNLRCKRATQSVSNRRH